MNRDTSGRKLDHSTVLEDPEEVDGISNKVVEVMQIEN